MKEKSHSVHVHCAAKDIDVEVKIAKTGPWYDRHRELISCPVLTDAGETCDGACLKPKTTPCGNQRHAPRVTIHI